MKKTKIIFVLILIVAISTIILVISKKDKTFEEININDKMQDNTLAIMIRDEGETKYKVLNDSSFPEEPYKYSGTTCVDSNGNEIANVGIVSYDNSTHKIKMTTTDTLKCYVHFSEPSDVISLVSQSENLEAEEDVEARGDVLRRFQGTAEKVNDNYICFGTDNPDECLLHQDLYMYRIIGYAEKDDTENYTNTKQGQLKLQKKEVLENPMKWGSALRDQRLWTESFIFQGINNADFLENKTYLLDEWKTKIADHTWWYGFIRLYSSATYDNGSDLFAIENGKANTEYYEYTPDGSGSETGTNGDGEEVHYNIIKEKWKNRIDSKVGLINLSDYYLSQGKNISCIADENCVNGWMHLSNNDINALSTMLSPNIQEPCEWILDQNGFEIYYLSLPPFFINYWGGINYQDPAWTKFVRPVIYTIASLQVIGEGTLNNPYIIVN